MEDKDLRRRGYFVNFESKSLPFFSSDVSLPKIFLGVESGQLVLQKGAKRLSCVPPEGADGRTALDNSAIQSSDWRLGEGYGKSCACR